MAGRARGSGDLPRRHRRAAAPRAGGARQRPRRTRGVRPRTRRRSPTSATSTRARPASRCRSPTRPACSRSRRPAPRSTSCSRSSVPATRSPRTSSRPAQRTFGRVIPSDEAQADAGAAWAKRLGVATARVVGRRKLRLTGDGERLRRAGEAVGDPVQRAKLTPPGWCAASRLRGGSPQRLLGTTRRRGPTGQAAALRHERRRRRPPDGDRRAARSRPAIAPSRPRRALVTSAAQDPSQLPASGQRFAAGLPTSATTARPAATRPTATRRWRSCSTRSGRAGDSGDDRDSVVDAFFDTHGPALGPRHVLDRRRRRHDA